VELLIVMTLLSFIVLGLLAVFNQTQRAFKVGMSQVDVLEGGRATMDLIVRDVEEMAALPGLGTNNSVNCLVYTPAGHQNVYLDLPGQSGNVPRANILQSFFFLSRVGQDWVGTAYVVTNGFEMVGTLFRFTTNVPAREVTSAYNPYRLFLNALNNNYRDFTRVVDGVIDFQVNTFRTNGFPVQPYDEYGYPWSLTNDLAGDYVFSGENPGKIGYTSQFFGDALPLAVEIQLGIVEPDVAERMRALPAAGGVRSQYLANESGKVHLFRQRVPIRRADPKVYNP
jgi:hypothetical protein